MIAPTPAFHFNCRFPTLPTFSTVSDGVLVVVVELETSLLVCADVAATASIIHSGAIASKFVILKEVVCFLLMRRIGDFIWRRPPHSSYISKERGVAQMEAVGFWP